MRLVITLAVSFALCALFSLAQAEELSELVTQTMFADFVTTYNKAYETREFFVKYNTFKSNLAIIADYNERALSRKRSSTTFTLRMNEFGDLSSAEFKKLMKLRPRAHLPKGNAPKHATGRSLPVHGAHPERASKVFQSGAGRGLTGKNHSHHHDWRHHGVVSPIKNQGQCGSCWAFSTIATMETANALKSGKLVEFSEQQLVSCSQSAGNEGCQGGGMANALDWLIETGGSCTEAEFPYVNGDEPDEEVPCQSCTRVGQISSYVSLPANDEDEMVHQLKKGVLSIAMCATSSAIQFAGTGIFNDQDCGTELDHGVALVGYGVDQDVPFFILRNSWGTSWGDQGYIRVQRGITPEGICGINMMPNRAVV